MFEFTKPIINATISQSCRRKRVGPYFENLINILKWFILEMSIQSAFWMKWEWCGFWNRRRTFCLKYICYVMTLTQLSLYVRKSLFWSTMKQGLSCCWRVSWKVVVDCCDCDVAVCKTLKCVPTGWTMSITTRTRSEWKWNEKDTKVRRD